jgi:hypothetical protein
MKFWKPGLASSIVERLKSLRPKSVGGWMVAAVPIVGGIIGIILGIQKLTPDPKAPRVSAVFILDVSGAMPAKKLAWAEKVILDRAKSSGVSTSLRLASTGCTDLPDASATINFASKNAPAYGEAFRNISAQPSSSLFTAIDSAGTDLTTKNLIADSPQKLLLVFVADPRAACFAPVGVVGSGLTAVVYWLGSGSARRWRGVIQDHLTSFGFDGTSIRLKEVHSRRQLAKSVRQTIKIPPCANETSPAAYQYCIGT